MDAVRSVADRLRRLSGAQQRRSQSQELRRSSLGLGGSGEGVPGGPDARLVAAGPGAVPDPALERKRNSIKTAKYNVVTFLPVFLFTMFSRVAYLYFLSQAALAYWSTVSPFSPVGPTLALTFVLLVAALKAIIEDRKRHQEDRRTNNSIAHVLDAQGHERDIKWKGVRVGQLLRVRDGEDFPADLLCLHCTLPEQVCYIRTTNLDGETNLKIRRPVQLGDATPTSDAEALALTGALHCEPPNPNLHYFVGQFAAQLPGGQRKVVPVTMDQMLLRGCTLRNSGSVLGLVVYTGPETRIQMNAAKPPRKQGSYDSFLNANISLILVLQFSLCLLGAGLSLQWRNGPGYDRYYLGFTSYTQGNYQNNFVYVLILFLTYWILMSYMVPISLFVTIEIIKFIAGGIIINFDKYMRDPAATGKLDGFARARNTDIIEDLGKVSYVFSDKTGTLTSNEMRLRQIAIKGQAYGRLDFKLEDQGGLSGAKALEAFDPRLARAADVLTRTGFWEEGVLAGGSQEELLRLGRQLSDRQSLRQWEGLAKVEDAIRSATASGRAPGGADGAPLTGGAAEARAALRLSEVVLGHHVLDFWTNVCCCHSLIVEGRPDGDAAPRAYQGPSPDEVALVEGGRQLGFEFLARTNDTITFSLAGRRVTHTLLNVLEFTSDRARMSVVTRAPDGTIRLHCKGSDAVMLTRLRPDADPALLAATATNLRDFSVEGLRTLVLASRLVPEAEWAAWNERYQAAAASLTAREEAIGAVAAQLERDLELLGVTAIEDKLQEGVPEAIQTLREAGMRVWMITGDKQETAVNIGVSCRLITSQDRLLMCNADSKPAAAELVAQLLKRAQAAQAAQAHQAANGVPSSPVVQPSSLLLAKADSEPAANGSMAGEGGAPLELVVDGRTLSYILGTPTETAFAALAAACASVLVCRTSPAQKASIVNMMRRHELDSAAAGATNRLQRWMRRRHKRNSCKSLAIGDGANDVAMIQRADIGVGILGKEGRQAANNSDYAIAQFRFLVRLLLVHGTLADYRLARLIKYSFYKNIAFAVTLWVFQAYTGWSGQALLDGVTAAFYNAVFTAIPIAAFAVADRPVHHLNTLLRFPQLYNRGNPLSTRSYWKTAVLYAVLHGLVCFFIPYYGASARGGGKTTDDLWSVGKTIFIALIGTVTLEIALVSRYWTKAYALLWSLSYLLVYGFVVLLPLVMLGFGSHDPAQIGVAYQLFGSAVFWLEILLIYAMTFGFRFMERSLKWIFYPNDNMIVAEWEKLQYWQAKKAGGPAAAAARAGGGSALEAGSSASSSAGAKAGGASAGLLAAAPKAMQMVQR